MSELVAGIQQFLVPGAPRYIPHASRDRIANACEEAMAALQLQPQTPEREALLSTLLACVATLRGPVRYVAVGSRAELLEALKAACVDLQTSRSSRADVARRVRELRKEADPLEDTTRALEQLRLSSAASGDVEQLRAALGDAVPSVAWGDRLLVPATNVEAARARAAQLRLRCQVDELQHVETQALRQGDPIDPGGELAALGLLVRVGDNVCYGLTAKHALAGVTAGRRRDAVEHSSRDAAAVALTACGVTASAADAAASKYAFPCTSETIPPPAT